MNTTNDFLIEIGTEELPPTELHKLANSFSQSIGEQLSNQQIAFSSLKFFATPRRLAVIAYNVNSKQPTKVLKRKGPLIAIAFDKNKQPTPAGLGFAKSCNTSIEQLKTESSSKGPCLYFEQTTSGEPTADCLPSIIEKALSLLPIAKKMRWPNSKQAFVRPVQWVVCLFGSSIIKHSFFGIQSSNKTRGHRFHYNQEITINSACEYATKLLSPGKVIADFQQRKDAIEQKITSLANAAGGQVVLDQKLLNLVTGLVEWPTPLLATFKQDFLSIPKPCLISAMQNHQKCFAIVNNQQELLAKFILISNIESTSPETVIQGNEKVMHARLADAAFYYNKDQKQPLAARLDHLKTIVFQQKLGSLFDKTHRTTQLACMLATEINANVEHTQRAALLAKTDLVTHMVYEFPELQGIMGQIYASLNNEPAAVATAIAEHYQPAFSEDKLPESLVGVCIALADRIDSLVGLFSIGKIPSGDKDPFALKRQALAILRILIEKKIESKSVSIL